MPKDRNIHVSHFTFHVSKRGFTMIELLVVLAIVMVITTITIPTIDAMTSPKHALRKEGRGIMALMTQARMAAMSRKVQVDLRIDSESREIRMVEARAFRSLQLDASYTMGSTDLTNRYEKTIVLDEKYELDFFSADQIVMDDEEDEPFSEAEVEPSEEEGGDRLAVSFSHFGGSSGGGISLVLDGVRLAIAADVLTGRPKVVKTSEATD